jgi:hypothetical protein
MYREFYFPVSQNMPLDSLIMHFAAIQAIVSNHYANVLQNHNAWKLVFDGLSVWRALCICMSHNLEYTSELTTTK